MSVAEYFAIKEGIAPHSAVRDLDAQGYVVATKVNLSDGTRCGYPSKLLIVLVHPSSNDVVVVDNQSGRFRRFTLGPMMKGVCNGTYNLDAITSVFADP